MLTKKRIIITLLVLIVFTLTAALTEIAETSCGENCLICQSERDIKEEHGFFFGICWAETTYSEVRSSPFCKDFPKHHCSHDWQADLDKDTEVNLVWDSPIIVKHYLHSASWYSPNAIIDGYNHSEKFRLLVNQLLPENKVTRANLLALSKNTCDDGGTCQMSREDPVESVLLEAIYEFWKSTIYQARWAN